MTKQPARRNRLFSEEKQISQRGEAEPLARSNGAASSVYRPDFEQIVRG
jgi:hypothetical protein